MSGRHYDASEWVAFFSEPGTPSKALLKQATRFERACAKAWAAYFGVQTAPPNTDPCMLAYLTYASAVGHGIGLWESGRNLVPDGEEEQLEKHMLSFRDVRGMANRLDESISACRERAPSEARAQVRG